MMSRFISLLLLFTLTACGGGFNPDVSKNQKDDQDQSEKPQPPKNIQQFSGKSVEVFSSSSLIFEDQSTEGSGKFVFTDYFERPELGFNFSLDFELDNNSEVKLISFADNELNNGVELIFTRKDKKLRITFKSSETTQNITPFLRKRISSNNPKLSVDIHNDHGSNPHILIWDESSHSLIFNSTLKGRGFGKYWGFELTESRLNFATVSEPRDDH